MTPNDIAILELLLSFTDISHGNYYEKKGLGNQPLIGPAIRFKWNPPILDAAKEIGFNKYELTKAVKRLKKAGLLIETPFTSDFDIQFFAPVHVRRPISLLSLLKERKK